VRSLSAHAVGLAIIHHVRSVRVSAMALFADSDALPTVSRLAAEFHC